MPISYYMRADEIWSLDGAVADTVGVTDTTYENEWLVSSIYGEPARSTVGSITWTVTNPAGRVDAVVFAHHNVRGGHSITIGGTIAASLTVPATRAHGIPRNPFASIAGSSSVTTLSVSVMAAVSPVVGKFFAGALRAVPRAGLLADGLTDGPEGQEANPGFTQGYDNATSRPRVFRGVVRCNDSQADDLMAAYEAQRNGTLPMILIPDIAINDARVVRLRAPGLTRNGLLWRAALEFVEFPQVRW